MDDSCPAAEQTAVAIIAGTAVPAPVASVLLYRVLRRHPRSFIVPLSGLGLTRSISEYQQDIEAHIGGELEGLGVHCRTRVVLVGHSQGGLAAARYALDHPGQVSHTITVGTPWSGLPVLSHTKLSSLPSGPLEFPALRDMLPNSAFLKRLHRDIATAQLAITNIYSANDLVIQPYWSGHLQHSHVRNVLVATAQQHREHLDKFADLPVDDLIMATSTHFDQMNRAEVRSLVWSAADGGSTST